MLREPSDWASSNARNMVRVMPHKRTLEDGTVVWRRSLWSFRTPSNRAELMIERISMGRTIHVRELNELADRVVLKVMRGRFHHGVFRAVVEGRIGICNGRWINPISDFCLLGSRIFKVVTVHPVAHCKWCTRPIFDIPPGWAWAAKYGALHCNARVCREIEATWTRKHKSLRVARPKSTCRNLNAQAERAQFMARFFIAKEQQLRKATSSCPPHRPPQARKHSAVSTA